MHPSDNQGRPNCTVPVYPPGYFLHSRSIPSRFRFSSLLLVFCVVFVIASFISFCMLKSMNKEDEKFREVLLTSPRTGREIDSTILITSKRTFKTRSKSTTGFTQFNTFNAVVVDLLHGCLAPGAHDVDLLHSAIV
ncbi:hypothetical protein J6590_014369 [Homalodisca vitripennis]|nr:hypothetical protein J6590_014369 [Homalodisca vitripennis]